MNDVFYYMLGYLSLFVVSFFLMNFISNGFLGTFIRVRASRGRKVLVEVHGLTNIYYRAGVFDSGVLIFKNLAKVRKRISNVPKSCVLRKLGVSSVSVDDQNDALLNPDFDGVAGHDGSKVDSMIVRALLLPQVKSKTYVVLLVLAVLLIIGLNVYGVVKLNEVVKLLANLKVQGVVV